MVLWCHSGAIHQLGHLVCVLFRNEVLMSRVQSISATVRIHMEIEADHLSVGHRALEAKRVGTLLGNLNVELIRGLAATSAAAEYTHTLRAPPAQTGSNPPTHQDERVEPIAVLPTSLSS